MYLCPQTAPLMFEQLEFENSDNTIKAGNPGESEIK